MEPIRRERLHDVVSKQLALAILRGETEKWSSEIALCRELEVSRSVLRESIKVLASKGLIELRPKLGLRHPPPIGVESVRPGVAHMAIRGGDGCPAPSKHL